MRLVFNTSKRLPVNMKNVWSSATILTRCYKVIVAVFDTFLCHALGFDQEARCWYVNRTFIPCCFGDVCTGLMPCCFVWCNTTRSLLKNLYLSMLYSYIRSWLGCVHTTSRAERLVAASMFTLFWMYKRLAVHTASWAEQRGAEQSRAARSGNSVVFFAARCELKVLCLICILNKNLWIITE